MILNRAYYLLKPILPWRLRLALRQIRASSKRKTFADVWPIDAKAGATPPGWPGWPDGKQFAFVLTHDVEGTKGLGRVERLMKLETENGFRSCFNFVPEGQYRLSDTLRLKLEEGGFEVGVHGLEHDGKLYDSKSRFLSKAARIRNYLKAWNAAGFRSPVTQHRLGWLHELGAEYDASAFDTDPFEPEPYGVNTLFPFWVPGPDGGGYVELPYTLVQDITLFTVLREHDIEIWKRKFDWVASRGGMVLVNVHPDYVCFDGNAPERDEFPVSFYEELLTYARQKYGGAYWPALPREVTRYYCAKLPVAARNTRKNVCLLAGVSYESDSRLQRYAEALVQRGDYVEVIAPRGAEPPGTVHVDGLTLHRLAQGTASERGKPWKAWRYLLASSALLRRRQGRIQFDLVHVRGRRDFMVFAAWYPKLLGAKVILDVGEGVPEAAGTDFGKGADASHPARVKKIGSRSAAFADHVIVPSETLRRDLLSRSIPEGNCSVFDGSSDSAAWDQGKLRYRILVDSVTTETFGQASKPSNQSVHPGGWGFAQDQPGSKRNGDLLIRSPEAAAEAPNQPMASHVARNGRNGLSGSQSDLLQVLAMVWSGILDREHVGADDNFFDIGGDSVLATQVVSRLRELFRMELPATCLFEAPTVAELASFLRARETQPGLVDRTAKLVKKLEGMTEEEVGEQLGAGKPSGNER